MVPEKVEEVLFFDLGHTKSDFQIATLNCLIWSLHSCTLLTNEVVNYLTLFSLYYLSHTGSGLLFLWVPEMKRKSPLKGVNCSHCAKI